MPGPLMSWPFQIGYDGKGEEQFTWPGKVPCKTSTQGMLWLRLLKNCPPPACHCSGGVPCLSMNTDCVNAPPGSSVPDILFIQSPHRCYSPGEAFTHLLLSHPSMRNNTMYGRSVNWLLNSITPFPVLGNSQKAIHASIPSRILEPQARNAQAHSHTSSKTARQTLFFLFRWISERHVRYDSQKVRAQPGQSSASSHSNDCNGRELKKCLLTPHGSQGVCVKMC